MRHYAGFRGRRHHATPHLLQWKDNVCYVCRQNPKSGKRRGSLYFGDFCIALTFRIIEHGPIMAPVFRDNKTPPIRRGEAFA